MKTMKLKPAEAARAKDEWLQAVGELEQQVRQWAEAQGWTVEQSEREVDDAYIGTYKAPVLEISTPQGNVHLEPIGIDVPGARGRVDLRAWPSLYRVMLMRKPDQRWVVRTESGINWPHPWGVGTFVELTEGLLGAE
jgi:hypothetical protein